MFMDSGSDQHPMPGLAGEQLGALTVSLTSGNLAIGLRPKPYQEQTAGADAYYNNNYTPGNL